MAPKPKVETPSIPDPADLVPSLENEPFIDDLLNRAKVRDAGGIETQVALVLGCADDYKIVLRSSILVDFVVEAILFASQHNYSAKKAIMFIKWLLEMRTSIETTGNVTEAKAMFRDQLVSHAEKAAKDVGSSSGSGGGVGDGTLANADAGEQLGSGTGGAAPAPTAAPAAKPPVAAKGKDAGKGKGRGGAEAEVAAPRTEAQVLFSIADMGHVAEYVTTGLLQHWRLWHLCSRDGVTWSAPTHFSLTVQTPMRPCPLARGIPKVDWDAQQEELRKRAETELAKLRQQELDAAEQERLERERKETEARLAREEQEASALYFQKKGIDEAVQIVHRDVEGQLGTRQQALLARLAKLEDLLRV